MIPKIIHYCWFGNQPLPESAQKCITSWKKHMPDYEIKEWNEDNFDVNMTAYTKEAYEAQKYAFVSDLARFWVLYHHGGIYFDVDVEMIRPIDDILAKGAFMGCEHTLEKDPSVRVAPGLGIASDSKDEIIKEIVDSYQSRHFIQEDSSFDFTTVIIPITNILKKHGLSDTSQGIQKVGNIYIYPQDYFCPMNYQTGTITITDNTRTIHHYISTWLTEENIYEKAILRKFTFLPNPIALRLAKYISLIRYHGIKESLLHLKNKISKRLGLK